ncbi:hypothetical protein MGYG_01935 [Nannizzia gypsea CBS 118893]|uniref:Uncharacterized protein n=1 Tax=Arthroderma gypseum (strain ATCC MYA-4604 / CBS 118893) TaxID=535722 RepID=E5QZ13_ARTGP|nr:hypothetical protein MGYG_01935 [Nannizzia gypsea CBS 118893]EFQ98922.1 hypothetical protein MGYG_01935 [Nannizzia gypsea CBS 118893]
MTLTVQALESVTYKHGVTMAFRHLYRTALKTVQYSSPSRYVIRWVLRSSFRKGTDVDFNPRRIVNTLHFLENASQLGSLERKILKTLTMVRYWQQPHIACNSPMVIGRIPRPQSIGARQFNRTLHLLNESMGLCLK